MTFWLVGGRAHVNMDVNVFAMLRRAAEAGAGTGTAPAGRARAKKRDITSLAGLSSLRATQPHHHLGHRLQQSLQQHQHAQKGRKRSTWNISLILGDSGYITSTGLHSTCTAPCQRQPGLGRHPSLNFEPRKAPSKHARQSITCLARLLVS